MSYQCPQPLQAAQQGDRGAPEKWNPGCACWGQSLFRSSPQIISLSPGLPTISSDFWKILSNAHKGLFTLIEEITKQTGCTASHLSKPVYPLWSRWNKQKKKAIVLQSNAYVAFSKILYLQCLKCYFTLIWNHPPLLSSLVFKRSILFLSTFTCSEFAGEGSHGSGTSCPPSFVFVLISSMMATNALGVP